MISGIPRPNAIPFTRTVFPEPIPPVKATIEPLESLDPIFRPKLIVSEDVLVVILSAIRSRVFFPQVSA